MKIDFSKINVKTVGIILGGILGVFFVISLGIFWYMKYMDTYIQLGFDEMKSKKSLVVYYSRKDNIEKIAKIIQQKTGADIYAIEPEDAYPTDDKEYIERVRKEKRSDKLIELAHSRPDITDYEVIYVGTPIILYSSAPIVNSYLRISKLDDKIILPFSVFNPNEEVPKGLYRMRKYAHGSIYKNTLLLNKNTPDNYDKEVVNWISKIRLTRRELKQIAE